MERTELTPEQRDARGKHSAGRSPQRPIRIPDDPWYRAVARAKSEGRPVGHVVSHLLERYADGDLDA